MNLVGCEIGRYHYDSRLFSAIKSDDPAKIERSIRQGERLEQAIPYDLPFPAICHSCVPYAESGGSGLHLAARLKRHDATKMLLKLGSYPNTLSRVGATPLTISVWLKDFENAEILVNSGAFVNVKGGLHGSPLNIAMINEDRKMIDFLLTHRANVNLETAKGFAYVVSQNNLELVQLFINEGIDVNTRFGGGCQALDAAKPGSQIEKNLLANQAIYINMKDTARKKQLIHTYICIKTAERYGTQRWIYLDVF